MKIQFFNPPVFYYGDMWFRMLPTMALPILCRVFNDAGHYAEAVDLEALRITPYQLQQKFSEQPEAWPDVVGITGLLMAEQGMKDCVDAIRASGFPGKIVIGGIYASTEPEKALAMGADLVITGECEANVVELITSGATGIQAGKALPIEAIPVPDWDHFSPAINTYHGNMALIRPNPGISMWTRGCPYQCIFCSDTIFFGQATRFRPPAMIEAEMRDLYRRGCRNINVYDDEMVGVKLPPGWMTEIADRIEDMTPEMQWITQGRCSRHHITLEILRDMKRAGCKVVFWGLESFSPPVLKAMKKVLTPEDVWHTLRLAREAGIDNAIYTMIGNYQETEADLALTVENLEKAYREGLIQYRQTTIMTIMPGTKIKTIAEREGWYKEAPLAGRDLHVNPQGTPWLTPYQIKYWQKRFDEACPVWIPQ
jgi:radical SAM superfamily enzyme YgiQ (UPF0313 family)